MWFFLRFYHFNNKSERENIFAQNTGKYDIAQRNCNFIKLTHNAQKLISLSELITLRAVVTNECCGPVFCFFPTIMLWLCRNSLGLYNNHCTILPPRTRTQHQQQNHRYRPRIMSFRLNVLANVYIIHKCLLILLMLFCRC